MTRTYRIEPTAARDSRLARARAKVAAETRGLYYAAREARALYEIEARAARETTARDHAREELARDMARATTRIYPALPDAIDTLDYDWRTR